jgi:hypothetical protein
MSFNNGYIEKTGSKILKHFLGCFPSDLEPETKKTNFSIVFNLSKHNEEGSHYIAIYTKKDNLIYFDSFGKPMKNVLIKNFVKKHLKHKKFSYNKMKIQDDLSSFCGIFCLSFLASQEQNFSLKEFLQLFNKKNLTVNNEISIHVLTSFIKQ